MIKQLNISKMKNLNYKTMRKLTFTLLMFMTLSLNAQNDGVIKFMGIPIDGSKSEMIDKLQEKGFAPIQVLIDLENAQNEVIRQGGEIPEGRIRERDGEYFMRGYFDGKDSKVIIVSYNNKVYQIMVVIDNPYNELNAKIQFDLYVEQLSKKYTLFYNFAKDILDKDLTMPFDNPIKAVFTTAYDESDKPHGMITLEMSHPRYQEFYLAFRYYNMDNMPNGEDL